VWVSHFHIPRGTRDRDLGSESLVRLLQVDWEVGTGSLEKLLQPYLTRVGGPGRVLLSETVPAGLAEESSTAQRGTAPKNWLWAAWGAT
jgi:hypothetical protein